ncbi:Dolichyl-phosphate-mannose-protein mannosyltransferase-domain-containing protein [Parasitella parasitica]|nr:Dolichyl-phosphate-mannose-protein mannosyltransferase-domain-containing protein [Parasitella parasitica]
MFSVRSRKPAEKTDDPFVVNDNEEKYEKKGVAYKEASLTDTIHDRMRLVVISSMGLYLRIMKLGFPAYITEIELETTKQVNWYMAGKFFIGKFPPLAGLVSTGLARLAGYYGSEELGYPGQPFVEFPVVALRRFSALLGASLVPLSYMTMRNMGHSRAAATLASALIIFENGIVTQSRYATPEVFVLFFSALATYSWTLVNKYTEESHGRLTIQAGLWQLISGISIGCAVSSKWTGIMTVPVIWMSILNEVWTRLGEKRNSIKAILRNMSVNILSTVLMPLCIYLAIFQFHFNMVPNAGDHDLLVSSRLKYSLQGNTLEPSQPNIAYGSQIVIRHEGTVGGYLHSHKKRFTGGSTQQEVTLYPHVDINNIWTVHKNNQIWNSSQPIEFVRNQDQIRLEHFASTRKLHSHDHRPQMTNKKEHNEVTAYGDRLIQDSHDYWTLKVLDDNNFGDKNKDITWKPLNQRFRLIHVRGCALISHNTYFAPPNGENHQEVTCMAGAASHVSSWIVESSYHEQLEGMQTISHGDISTKQKFEEVHRLMAKYSSVVYDRLQTGSHNDGTASPKFYREENANKWFFQRASLRIWSELAGYSAHLVLNPIVQRLILSTMVAYFGFLGLNAFLVQRQIKLPSYLMWLHSIGMDTLINDFYTRSIAFFYSASVIQVLCLRFLPYHVTAMPDILGAIYYGIGLAAAFLEACTTRLSPTTRRTVLYGLLLISIVKFSQLSHLSYGGEKWYRADCTKSDLDIDCIRFPPHETELAEMVQNSGQTQNSTLLTIYVEVAGNTQQPFRYNQGQEAEADNHIAILKQQAYLKESQIATNTLRYHRVIPTTAMTPEEAAKWAKDVYEGAMNRKKAAEEAALKAEKEKKGSNAPRKKTKAKKSNVQGGPIMNSKKK